MSKRDPKFLIADIIDSGTKILEYIGEMDFDAFIEDSKTVDAANSSFRSKETSIKV